VTLDGHATSPFKNLKKQTASFLPIFGGCGNRHRRRDLTL
jgi:hypothetical protein